MRVTVEWLRQRGATCGQVEVFAQEWPAGAEITRANLARAGRRHLDLDWLAARVLTAPAWAEYARVRAPARAEYERVTATAWAEYARVTAPARAEYERVRAPAWAEYERVTASAWAEYERVTAPARAEYARVAATALADALGLPEATLCGACAGEQDGGI